MVAGSPCLRRHSSDQLGNTVQPLLGKTERSSERPSLTRSNSTSVATATSCPESTRRTNEPEAPSQEGTEHDTASPGPTNFQRYESLVAHGLKNSEIAKTIGTTRHVVKNYLRVIYDKLGLWNRVELALWYEVHKQPHDTMN
jgi:DNA-binding NarL/FixJ family response regulator